ncbi:MAG TPA: tRNA epoxyqueuosine(34) reductase QueG [Methylomirabilota bacterium]|nr:tRNA epoxyqueuosine(34) reductase QueG [Methylomirabilota bacterium]
MTLAALALTRTVKERALELGFDRVAVGAAAPPPHGEAFERWLDAGYAGDMEYLHRGRAERLDPGRLLPGWRSVVAVALNYARRDDDPAWRGVARYARGRDYHGVIRPRLEALKEVLRAAAGPDVRSRASVDTSAVLERGLAAAAGLGWMGKNTNLIAPGLGSYFFIGIVLTTARLAPDSPLPDRCGTCTACLDACPTGAFVGPYMLDARRCISYLTIEHRGDIDPSLHRAIGGWIFGCDVCQEVCPWNRHAPPTHDAELLGGTPPGAPEVLAALTDGDFRERFRGSALKRARREGLARNARIVLANSAARNAYISVTGTGLAELSTARRASSMADDKMKQNNKDAESGEPVQLDKEQQGGQQNRPQQQPGQQQGGQQNRPHPQQQPGQQQAGQQHEGGQKR